MRIHLNFLTVTCVRKKKCGGEAFDWGEGLGSLLIIMPVLSWLKGRLAFGQIKLIHPDKDRRWHRDQCRILVRIGKDCKLVVVDLHDRQHVHNCPNVDPIHTYWRRAVVGVVGGAPTVVRS